MEYMINFISDANIFAHDYLVNHTWLLFSATNAEQCIMIKIWIFYNTILENPRFPVFHMCMNTVFQLFFPQDLKALENYKLIYQE